LTLTALVGAAHLVSGCLVLGLNPFYDASAIVNEPRLAGAWEDADDGVSVTIEPGDWHSVRVAYSHPIEKGTLTGYVFTAGGLRLLDLTVVHGEDPGSFVVAGHALVKLDLSASELRVSPLDFDALAGRLRDHGLPGSLRATVTDRRQLVFAGPSTALHEWAAAQVRDAGTFGPVYAFHRVK
jgi:hypothetical protein